MIHFPAVRQGPLRALSVRLVAAIGLVLIIVFVVYVDRDGYRDVNEDGLTLLDCVYYAVVTLSTTGYGDITPVSPSARLVNVLVITPARVLFLIILVGTTLEVLTEQYRTNLRLTRWRKTVKDHVIICGYGTKGRSAVSALLETGYDKSRIVVVERSDDRRCGRPPRTAWSRSRAPPPGRRCCNEAHVKNAKAVIIATDSDDASVLVTLTVRQLTAGQVRIIAAVREAENAPLLKQSGAHHVIVSSATAGRLLGLSTSAPPLIDVVEDLLTPGQGMALAMRSAERHEVGTLAPRAGGAGHRADPARQGGVRSAEPAGITIETGDMLVYVRDDRRTSRPDGSADRTVEPMGSAVAQP